MWIATTNTRISHDTIYHPIKIKPLCKNPSLLNIPIRLCRWRPWAARAERRVWRPCRRRMRGVFNVGIPRLTGGWSRREALTRVLPSSSDVQSAAIRGASIAKLSCARTPPPHTHVRALRADIRGHYRMLLQISWHIPGMCGASTPVIYA